MRRTSRYTSIRMTVSREGVLIHSAVFAVNDRDDFAPSVAAELRKFELDNPDDEPLWNASFSFESAPANVDVVRAD
jgi:hypothetical protein